MSMLKKAQEDLVKWGKQKWRTSDGSESKGKKRYLPDSAWKSLSSAEKTATNAAKAKGNKEGKQQEMVTEPEIYSGRNRSLRCTTPIEDGIH